MAYKRICPREEFLKETSIRFGATKQGALRSIMKNVIMHTWRWMCPGQLPPLLKH